MCVGADVVDWLENQVQGFTERREARKYASQMLKAGYIRHTVNKITFSEQCYYIFGDLLTPISSGRLLFILFTLYSIGRGLSFPVNVTLRRCRYNWLNQNFIAMQESSLGSVALKYLLLIPMCLQWRKKKAFALKYGYYSVHEDNSVTCSFLIFLLDLKKL